MGRGRDHAAEYRILVRMLRDLREEAGLTQAEISERLGQLQSYVSKVERGTRLIDPVELRRWCKALGKDVSRIVREWDKKLS